MSDKITVRVDASPDEHVVSADDCLFHVRPDMSVTVDFVLAEGQKISILLSAEIATLFSESLSAENRKRLWEGAQSQFQKSRH